jgi:hypothetical protein
VQPAEAAQASSVHLLPSLQLKMVEPAVHILFMQLSPRVQAFPSSQEMVLAVWVHPPDGLHASMVQGFSSSQSRGSEPMQLPPEHAAMVVQAFPSSQLAVFGVWIQVPLAAQLSSVHGFPSMHWLVGPETQAPLEQLSFKVQGSPSSQAPSMGLLMQPPPPAQMSTVHGLSSLHDRSPLPPQVPPEQMSPVVQAFLSSQVRVLLV